MSSIFTLDFLAAQPAADGQEGRSSSSLRDGIAECHPGCLSGLVSVLLVSPVKLGSLIQLLEAHGAHDFSKNSEQLVGASQTNLGRVNSLSGNLLKKLFGGRSGLFGGVQGEWVLQRFLQSGFVLVPFFAGQAVAFRGAAGAGAGA